eukprot:scaffold4337_cov182-Ochromonas_danica.AAC.3
MNSTSSDDAQEGIPSRIRRLPKDRKSKADIVVNIAHTKYGVITCAANVLNWKTSNKKQVIGDGGWDIAWIDAGQGVDRVVREMKSYQRVNHFPGMVELYRKDKLARTIQRMRSLCPHDYNFTPCTWYLPQDYELVANYLRQGKGKRCVILKPAGGAQGRGIHLALNPTDLFSSSLESYIVQPYLANPLIVDGYKFDIRIYVLVTSCDPPRIYIYREGLCRFCTAPYTKPTAENIENSFMHLTNYSINKHNTAFVPNNNNNQQRPIDRKGNANESSQEEEDDDNDERFASKRSLAWLRHYLQSKGVSYDQVFAEISHLAVKTILSNLRNLRRAMQDCKLGGQNKSPFTCFELLGFDIILTDKYRPILLEVNHMPSFSTQSSLDSQVKLGLMIDTFHLLHVDQEEKEKETLSSTINTQMRLYGDVLSDDLRRRYKAYVQSQQAKTTKKGRRRTGEEEKVDIDPYWSAYLANESDALGNYDLIYPADVYANQPTADRQTFYQYLLHLIEEYLPPSGQLLLPSTTRTFNQNSNTRVIPSYEEFLVANGLEDEDYICDYYHDQMVKQKSNNRTNKNKKKKNKKNTTILMDNDNDNDNDSHLLSLPFYHRSVISGGNHHQLEQSIGASGSFMENKSVDIDSGVLLPVIISQSMLSCSTVEEREDKITTDHTPIDHQTTSSMKEPSSSQIPLPCIDGSSNAKVDSRDSPSSSSRRYEEANSFSEVNKNRLLTEASIPPSFDFCEYYNSLNKRYVQEIQGNLEQIQQRELMMTRRYWQEQESLLYPRHNNTAKIGQQFVEHLQSDARLAVSVDSIEKMRSYASPVFPLATPSLDDLKLLTQQQQQKQDQQQRQMTFSPQRPMANQPKYTPHSQTRMKHFILPQGQNEEMKDETLSMTMANILRHNTSFGEEVGGGVGREEGEEEGDDSESGNESNNDSLFVFYRDNNDVDNTQYTSRSQDSIHDDGIWMMREEESANSNKKDNSRGYSDYNNQESSDIEETEHNVQESNYVINTVADAYSQYRQLYLAEYKRMKSQQLQR